MQIYEKAWEKQDCKLILKCFTKNGVYQQSPLEKPYRGHKEIEKFWHEVVCKETHNIKFRLKKCYISADRKTGFAEWECKNRWLGKKQSMAGIMILKMREFPVLSTKIEEFVQNELEFLPDLLPLPMNAPIMTTSIGSIIFD